MELSPFFKSLIEQDNTSIVICNLEHEIIYMNPVAIEKHGKRGGAALIGKSLLACHNPHSCEMIIKVVDWFKSSKDNNRIYTYFNEKENKDVYMIALRDDKGQLIGYYEKHEYRDKETCTMYDFN